MTEMNRRRVRSDAIWAEARKAWEGGETAKSVAKRYDVGVPALWKRREAEAWKRPVPGQSIIEPGEGWDGFASKRLAGFESRRDEARLLALTLLGMLEGGPPESAPSWHIGWLFRERAERRGPEVAEADRIWAEGRAWAGAVWDETGAMRPQEDMDRLFLTLWRDDWRKEIGLPEGAAPSWP